MERKNRDRKFVLRLVSRTSHLDDIEVHEGEVMIIGRKTIPKIKDLKCPSQLFEIEVRAEENKWFTYIKNMATGEVGLLKNEQEVKGPGFSYEAKYEENILSSVLSAGPQSQDSFSPKAKKTKLSESSDSSSSATKNSAFMSSSTSDEDRSSSWKDIIPGSVMVYKYLGGGKASSKIASFDFDGTIVKVKSKAKFPKDGNDWLLLDKKLPDLIRKYENSHRFVIFSNQMGVSLGNMPFENIKNRIEKSLEVIGVPCLAFLALKDDPYRKPSPGMFSLFKKEFNSEVEVNLSESFFVGDAAGRRTALNRDHSKFFK